MKRIGLHLILVVLLMCMTGCSSIQSMWGGGKDMDSARHWNMLANQVANQINLELMRQKKFTTTVYVQNGCGLPNKCGPNQTFPFDEGFHDLLINQLVNFGVHTVSSPTVADLVLEYKVQAVYHPPKQSTWNVFADDGHYEVVVSTYIVDQNKYVFLFSDIYNIPKTEFWQYSRTVPATPIRLTGPEAPSLPPMKK